jgi:hypothetical protein
MVTLRCGGTTVRHGGSARFQELVFAPLEISTRPALRRLNTSCATSSVAALDYLSDGDADVLVVLACVRLRGLCPSLYRATPERRTRAPPRGRPWSRRRLSACERGLCPRQRSNICSHATNGPGRPRGRQLSLKGRVTCVYAVQHN